MVTPTSERAELQPSTVPHTLVWLSDAQSSSSERATWTPPGAETCASSTLDPSHISFPLKLNHQSGTFYIEARNTLEFFS